MSVYRIYVEKKPGFAVEAEQLLKDIRLFLRITRLETLRILNRYDVEGIDAALFEACKTTVFSEPQVDSLYDRIPDSDYSIAVEFLPGQYDQRADSCAQCIQIVSQKQRPAVRTARIFLLNGPLTEEDIVSIRSFLINPVECREASHSLFDSLAESYETPPPVPAVTGFCRMDQNALSSFLKEAGLAMDEADLAFCQQYFQSENRDPSITEIRMIDTYWSDHCRHTTFQTIIDEIEIEDEKVAEAFELYRTMRREIGRGERAVTLMDLATVGAKYLVATVKLTNLDVSEEINACSVKIPVDVDGETQDWLLMFKNETHNHPTEIEPFGGAATCIGGAIRDPLSGRSYVYQAMRITGAGDPLTPVENTPAGKLPQRKLVTTAAAGYSSYGNQIGLATGLVNEIYHPGYVAKRMELGAVIGAAPARQVVREVPQPGDAVILLGGKTGRDGCGGATGSSKSHSVDSLSQCGAEVQKGNAPEERKIQRLFREEKVTRLIKRCNDFGAGGVSVAIGELADGLSIQLDAVPKKYEGLDGTELAISESQERMAVVIAASDVETFLGYAREENLEATVVAHVTGDRRLTMEWRGETIVDLSRDFLNSNGAPKHTSVKVTKPGSKTISANCGSSVRDSGGCGLSAAAFRERLAALVSDLNVCSQKGLIERFDSTIGAATVLMPLGGVYQATPAQAMAAKLPVLSGKTETCSVMAYGFDPYLSSEDPYKGAYSAVVESVARLVASGAPVAHTALSFQEYFQKLGSDPTRWGKPFSALLGALKAQKDLSVGAIGGKDSMSGSFEELHVPPTLVSFAASWCSAEDVLSPEFKKEGSRVFLVSPAYDTDGLPEAESLSACFAGMETLSKQKKLTAACTLTKGGAGEGLFKMALGNRIGLRFGDGFPLTALFEKKYGSFLIETSEEPAVIAAAFPESVQSVPVGTTSANYEFVVAGETISLMEMETLYNEKLSPVYPSDTDRTAAGQVEEISFAGHAAATPASVGAPAIIKTRPLALIPVFPGTNCEYDTARALEDAGAEPHITVIRNLGSQDITESVDEVARQIARSQIIVLPGGFSGGDEPDGSGKFITAFFRNPLITERVTALLSDRDGLMLGICNGFQALIKLGLVPFGHITEMTADCPTLAGNNIGRHQSRLVRTRVASNRSPWLMSSSVGDLHTMPVSHGEGRFIASDALMKSLIENGQIATQYVDALGQPTMEIQYNPNGSVYAVEGITSPDGRVFGKMGHSERRGDFVHKNVPGNMNQHLFDNAVRYYSL